MMEKRKKTSLKKQRPSSQKEPAKQSISPTNNTKNETRGWSRNQTEPDRQWGTPRCEGKNIEKLC